MKGDISTSFTFSSVLILKCLQVYEYFISHHLTKSFESLFGSITCLPGCFTIYRLRAPDTHKPLFVSQQIVGEYQENRVDTLHMKNLLHLGEDRYLTTLILKHFPGHKTKFVRDAHAYTVAPDDWKVLLSQREYRFHPIGISTALKCVYSCSRSTMDQLNSSQSGGIDDYRGSLRILRLLRHASDRIHRFAEHNHCAGHCGLREPLLVVTRYLTQANYRPPRLSLVTYCISSSRTAVPSRLLVSSCWLPSTVYKL